MTCSRYLMAAKLMTSSKSYDCQADPWQPRYHGCMVDSHQQVWWIPNWWLIARLMLGRWMTSSHVHEQQQVLPVAGWCVAADLTAAGWSSVDQGLCRMVPADCNENTWRASCYYNRPVTFDTAGLGLGNELHLLRLTHKWVIGLRSTKLMTSSRHFDGCRIDD